MNIKIIENIEDFNIINFNDSHFDIEDVLSFYNHNFPKSQHSIYMKEKIINEGLMLLSLNNNGELIGLLEAYYPTDTKPSLLITLVVDVSYRGKNIAQKLFDKMLQDRYISKPIILHFRDSNKHYLEKFYKKLNFKNLKNVGEYLNGEIKWEMIYY